MPYRRIYRNRHRRALFGATKPWAAWAAIAAASAIAVFVLAMPESVRAPSITSIRQSARGLLLGRSERAAGRVATEKIYPYSIIAGGVHNKQQFEEATRTDPVAAAHYANFELSKFHLVKLQHAEEAYVSFRVGNNIYWTSHKVKLPKGAILISDGKLSGRTRCGNRVSETPRLPTYNHEPSARELNTAITPGVRTEAFAALPPSMPGVQMLPLSPFAPNQPLLPGPGPRRLASTTPPASTPFIGTPFFTPPLGCSNGKDKPASNCNTATTPPPTPTPEDGAWVLFLTGAVILAGYSRKRLCVRG